MILRGENRSVFAFDGRAVFREETNRNEVYLPTICQLWARAQIKTVRISAMSILYNGRDD
jgi:hypothetical protein